MLQFASYSFDASVLEMVASLLFGGALVIPTAEEILDSALAALP